MFKRAPQMKHNEASENAIVISGISGRFPESSNFEEFKQQLFEGVDLVTEDERRWPTGMYGLPTRNGKLKDLTRFDASFFGVHAKQANSMDPQQRILLELTHEALIDAGINPTDLRGSNTGVFVGMSFSESGELWTSDVQKINGYELLGSVTAIFSNRISYCFDFKGPSSTIHTACSSSMLALHQAMCAIRNGECDSAIVGGTNVLLKPETSLQFHRLKMLSPEGMCKAFDSSGNGYVRSEAAAIIVLQRASIAKRVYATVLGTKTNTDGNKEQGITFPSGEMQGRLLKEVYAEARVDPAEVEYVEAHGTGTKIGDPQEINAIVDVFCKNNRKVPLLIGSVKSNMGHSEPASGVCSISKIIIAMESGLIPGNLHYKNPNQEIPGLSDGSLKVISKNEPWNGGIVGVNSFGFGGTNVHAILSSNTKPKASRVPVDLPRLITVSGRTEEAVNYFLDKIGGCDYDEELYALIDAVHSSNINKHSYRGFSIRGENIKEITKVSEGHRPIWFVFAGMGSQWPGMGRELMKFEPFRNSIKRSANALIPYGIDLQDILINGDEKSFENIRNSFTSIVAIQIALVDILKLLNIEPDGILGHSVGEVGCAYADGSLTAEQTMLVAYFRGTAILESNCIEGSMAAVGLTWEECKKRCPPDIYTVCHNSENSVTISGPPKSINAFVEQLTKEDIFARKVNSSGLALHTKYIADAGPKFLKALELVIPNPKPRSHRWISTSIPQSNWNSPLAQHCSAEYHVNNLLSPVTFHEATQFIPDNAILLELAPHSLLQAILKRSLANTITNIGLLKKGHPDNVKFLLSNIGRIYNAGGQPKISGLYPQVSWPVGRGTPMLCNMIQWDHSTQWSVAKFLDKGSRSGELVVDIDLSKKEFQYLVGHTIDGRILFPATGYMILAWKTFAQLRNVDYEQLPIVLEEVTFSRATIMPTNGSVKFLVNILEGSGEFEICESGAVAASGKIYVPEDIEKEFSNTHTQNTQSSQNALPLGVSDIYKELRLRGYDYEDKFRGIQKSDNYGSEGILHWENNWISFIDTMLQFSILGLNIRELNLPTRLHKLIINPKAHVGLNKNQIPVYMHRKIGVVKAGAIELRGMKCSLAPRRQQAQVTPKLEKYQFIPLENSALLAEDLEKSTYNALTVVSQIVFENSFGALKLKVVEVVGDGNTFILPKVQEICESEPVIQLDGVIIASNPIDKTLLAEKTLKVTQKDITSEVFERNAHMVILVGVLEKSQDKMLDNAISSLKPGGFILFVEPKGQPNTQLLVSHSLVIICQQESISEMYVLARKSEDIPQEPIIVRITENNYDWVEPLKQALKSSENNGTRVYLVCQGESLTGLVGMVNCIKQEPGGINIRSVFIQDSNAEPFSITSNYYKNQLNKGLVHNILKNGVWGTYRHILLNQVVDNGQIQAEHAYVNVLTRGDLSSLKWIEGPLKFTKGAEIDTELCTVYYAPLNFRDVMLATGKLSADALPGDLATQDCILGLEFSGRDSMGRRVMGMVAAKSLATTVLADPEFLWEVPEKWSLEEAATIPIVYGTSYYALIVRGRMQPGEYVLIHAGTGGVGQASIAIALHMGCKVFTTVSTQTKRDFLKTRFPQLTDDCIGYSRDTSFEQMILTQTNGRGVDLVLNSLAGNQLQASVRCLANDGRFLEIGKVDLSNNSALGMSLFLKNTTFHGVLLDALFVRDHADRNEVHRLVTEGIASGAVRPLPNTIYLENQVEQAFRFMASGKHIGKVLLKLREEECHKTVSPDYKTISAVSKSYMDPEKVYVLVGGLGGFGLELTKWLISRGAKKIVLSSRSGIKNGYQSLCVRRSNTKNAIINISTADVTTESGARRLLEESNKIGLIGGIFNLAAVLVDGMMDSQNEDNFKIVCKPKIDGTKHLDIASRSLAPQLEYFVVFSSVSCGRGNAGQVNYGYANSAMERICEARQALGLPATAIQWGAIGDVGLILDMFSGAKEIGGTVLQNISSCLSTLDIFLQQLQPVVSSMVLPEKRKGTTNTQEIKLTDVVANILGVKCVKSIPPESTLVELGMDSLMGAEIKQTLERNFDVVFSAQEIRKITFAKLTGLDAGTDSSSSQEKIGEDAKSNPTVADVDELIPTKTLVKMPSKESSIHKTPVFLISPIEGVLTGFGKLAHEIQAPVYGLQCTESAPLDTIANLAKYYIAHIKSIQEKGPYRIIGYSFGACVAFEIGVQLEAVNEKVKILLIDGSPSYVATRSKLEKAKRNSIGNIASEQSEVLLFFIRQFMEVDDHQKVAAELTSLNTWDERLRRTTEMIGSSSSFPADQISVAATRFYYKIVAAEKYEPATQFNGELLLVQAIDNYIHLGEDYGLNKICKQRVMIKALEGNHRTVIKNPALCEVVNAFYNKMQ